MQIAPATAVGSRKKKQHLSSQWSEQQHHSLLGFIEEENVLNRFALLDFVLFAGGKLQCEALE